MLWSVFSPLVVEFPLNVKETLHSSNKSLTISLVIIGVLISLNQDGSNTVTFSIHSTSLKYSKPSVTDGSRLLLVCDVALGRCREVYKTDILLKQAPDGYDSVRGVRRTPNTPSEFEVQ